MWSEFFKDHKRSLHTVKNILQTETWYGNYLNEHIFWFFCLGDLFKNNLRRQCWFLLCFNEEKEFEIFYFAFPTHSKVIEELHEWLNWEVYSIDELDFGWKQKRQLRELRTWLIAAKVFSVRSYEWSPKILMFSFSTLFH